MFHREESITEEMMKAKFHIEKSVCLQGQKQESELLKESNPLESLSLLSHRSYETQDFGNCPYTTASLQQSDYKFTAKTLRFLTQKQHNPLNWTYITSSKDVHISNSLLSGHQQSFWNVVFNITFFLTDTCLAKSNPLFSGGKPKNKVFVGYV